MDIESKAMTKEDIAKVQNYFVQAALRAKQAGCDGVEIHGAQLSLLSLFCSSKYNTRTDEYGGSDENRARIIVEIAQKIREAISNDMIISAKIVDLILIEVEINHIFIMTLKKLQMC